MKRVLILLLVQMLVLVPVSAFAQKNAPICRKISNVICRVMKFVWQAAISTKTSASCARSPIDRSVLTTSTI